MAEHEGQDRFATTHWSVVQGAGLSNSTRARAAWETLCRSYWYPLYAFTRRLGHGPADAEDLIQSFFLRCWKTDFMRGANRERGRFRSYLLIALKRYVANEYHKSQTRKRGGGRAMIHLDGLEAERRYALEPVDLASPDKLYDRRWTLTLLERVLGRLEAEEGGRKGMFERLKGVLTASRGGRRYAELARDLGMSEGAVKVAVHRLRRRYGELLEEEIAQTVCSRADLREERRQLLAALSAEG